MQLGEYELVSGRTEPKQEEMTISIQHSRILHAVLGIAGEASEVLGWVLLAETDSDEFRKRRLEEYGDMFWYIALYCRVRHCTIDYLASLALATDFGESPTRMIHHLVVESGTVLDEWKKVIFYKREPDLQMFDRRIGEVILILKMLIDQDDASLTSVLKTNVDKLKARYPAGFSEDKANNRDTVAEDKVIQR